MKDLTLLRLSEYIMREIKRLLVNLADESFDFQIKEICTITDVGEALAQLLELAYGSKGNISIEDAAKKLYDVVYGSNRKPFVYAWKQKLYKDIQDSLNIKVKIHPGKQDPFSDMISRAVCKVQNEILSVVENRLGMQFNAKKPDPSKFDLSMSVLDTKAGLPRCWMSYSGELGRVNGEAHLQELSSQLIIAKLSISKAVQILMMPENDHNIKGGRKMLPPEVKELLWQMISDCIGIFTGDKSLDPKLQNLLYSYKARPSSEQVKIINRTTSEFEAAASAATTSHRQLAVSTTNQASGRQPSYQSAFSTTNQGQFSLHNQAGAAAAAGGGGQQYPSYNTESESQQVQTALFRDNLSQAIDYSNRVARDINKRHGTHHPQLVDNTEMVYPASHGDPFPHDETIEYYAQCWADSNGEISQLPVSDSQNAQLQPANGFASNGFASNGFASANSGEIHRPRPPAPGDSSQLPVSDSQNQLQPSGSIRITVPHPTHNAFMKVASEKQGQKGNSGKKKNGEVASENQGEKGNSGKKKNGGEGAKNQNSRSSRTGGKKRKAESATSNVAEVSCCLCVRNYL